MKTQKTIPFNFSIESFVITDFKLLVFRRIILIKLRHFQYRMIKSNKVVRKGRFVSGLFSVIICVFEAENENKHFWWSMSLNWCHRPCIFHAFALFDSRTTVAISSWINIRKNVINHRKSICYYHKAPINLIERNNY